MKESDGIVELLNRTFYGPAWHGAAVYEILQNINYTSAARNKIENAHNICDIVAHIAVWKDAAIRFLNGEDVKVPDEIDWCKAVAYDESGWEIIKTSLYTVHQQLVEKVKTFPDEKLNEIVPGKDFTFYVLLHGVMQHDVYHAGQIAILKK